jgi:hypothetical protein
MVRSKQCLTLGGQYGDFDLLVLTPSGVVDREQRFAGAIFCPQEWEQQVPPNPCHTQDDYNIQHLQSSVSVDLRKLTCLLDGMSYQAGRLRVWCRSVIPKLKAGAHLMWVETQETLQYISVS